MLAVIKTGGKQYLVSPGDKIKIEKKDEEQGKEIIFGDVLLLAKPASAKAGADKSSHTPNGVSAGEEKLEIGTPQVKDAKVIGKILEQGKDKKKIIFKFKAKKRYKKKAGHRQPYTEVEITEIQMSKSK